MNMGITETPKLWKPYFPKEGIVLLCGGSDCGKTTFAKQMAIGIARGDQQFLGFDLNLTHGKALAVLSEDSAEAVSASLHKQLQGQKDEQVAQNLLFLFETENIIADLDNELTETPVDFVFIDTLTDFFDGNPNNLIDVRQNMNRFNNLAKKHHCCICFIHHTVKNSDKSAPDKAKVNGSQAFEAKVRTVIEIRYGSEGGTRLLTVLKSNYMSQASKKQSLKLAFDEDTLTFFNKGETIPLADTTTSAGRMKYDPAVWMGRYQDIYNKGCTSIADARRKLVLEYGDETPGDGWFKQHVKQLYVFDSE